MTADGNSEPDEVRRHSETISRWVREHARPVRGFLLGLVRRADVADDLLQTVFERAWRARDRYRDDARERAYLLQIADRLACDWFRRAGREVCVTEEVWQRLEPGAPDPEPLDILIQQETQAELAAALDRLTLVQRRVLLLRYFGEMEFAEIAATLAAPLGTVLSHCRRGLLALRSLLVENEP
jgi:RNA polymerase sigma-70 factor (ECF subfamily)